MSRHVAKIIKIEMVRASNLYACSCAVFFHFSKLRFGSEFK